MKATRRKATPKATPGAANAPGAAPTLEAPAVESPFANLDRESNLSVVLSASQRALVERIGESIEAGRFDLPHLPSTNLAIMNMAANPGIEVAEIVSMAARDPALTSRLLKTANSVVYATRNEAETLHEAVMRIGMRSLRSLIFSLSMRSLTFRNERLQACAEETWRQSHSVGLMARLLGPAVGIEAEHAFLLGLLHDVGKASLLSMLQKEVEDPDDLTPALVSRIFAMYHERAGVEMAKRWKLSDELASVAGCHHDFRENEAYPRSAAMALLAHRMDLYLSGGDSESFWALAEGEEMEFLGLDGGQAGLLLVKASEIYTQSLRNESEQQKAA